MPTKARRPRDPDLVRDAEKLQKALAELLRIYQFRDRKRICCHDISVTQCQALEALVRRGGLTLGELAHELFLDKSTASRVVDALERKGYLRRGQDPADGRAIRLDPTDGGRELHARIEADLVEGHRRLLCDFDPEVRRATIRIVARLAREAAARFSRQDGSCCELLDGESFST
jgi:DNA-binding MarR family transcriptional regulator